jgi:hypothetical protein
MPVEEKPRSHKDITLVKIQPGNASQEQSSSQGGESVDDAKLTTDDELPEHNAVQESKENSIWVIYGIHQPKRREILHRTTMSSTYDVTMRLKREIDSEEWTNMYIAVLDSLAANYVEV